jgi:hypothetical protein
MPELYNPEIKNPSIPKYSQGDCFVFADQKGVEKTAVILFPYLVAGRAGWNYLAIEGQKDFMEIVKHFDADPTVNHAMQKGLNFKFKDDIEASVFFEYRFHQPQRSNYKIFYETDLDQLKKGNFAHLPIKFFDPNFKTTIPRN